MRLTEKSNRARAMNAEVRHTGIVIAGMSIVRKVPRNASITKLTRTVVMAIV